MLISCVTPAQISRDTCSIRADSLHIQGEIFTSHIYNFVNLAGTLPEDKETLLAQVRQSLEQEPTIEKELTYKNYGIF